MRSTAKLPLTVAGTVLAFGVELAKAYLWVRRRSLTLAILVPVMLWGWFVSAGQSPRACPASLMRSPTIDIGIMVALFPDLTYLSGLVISACLTPTDPILAAAVVGGHCADKNDRCIIARLLMYFLCNPSPLLGPISCSTPPCRRVCCKCKPQLNSEAYDTRARLLPKDQP